MVFMYGGGSEDEGHDNITPDLVEMGSAFIVACVSSFVACFYEIYKHNNMVEDSKP